MAGVGVAHPQFWYVNNQNPALLVHNYRTIFQAGLVAEQRQVSADTITSKSWGGNLNYLVTSFPIAWTNTSDRTRITRWVSSLTLSPLTTVDYLVRYNEDIIGSTSDVQVTEEGKGGITQLSWSNGVRITNDLAVGLRASYVFGSIINKYQNIIIGSEQPSNFAAAIEEKSYVKDFTFTSGISYSIDSLFSRNRYRLSFGAVYDFAGDLKTKTRHLIYRTNDTGDIFNPDTLTSTRGVTSLPSGLTFGAALSRGSNWTVATEFSTRDWSDFRSVNREDEEGLGKSWKFALGAETTPDAFATGSYLKRVTYRVGMSMEQYPFVANGKKVQDLGINFGFSLPAGFSSIDLGFRYGQRGSRVENLIEEKYFRIFFGVTFNDTWFIPRKFE
jgi:hypothetical protein